MHQSWSDMGVGVCHDVCVVFAIGTVICLCGTEREALGCSSSSEWLAGRADSLGLILIDG